MPQANIAAKRNNYVVTVDDRTMDLKRDVDFGMILKKDGSPISKKPTLFKSGAEKLLWMYGVRYEVEIVDSYKNFETGFFYYECKATAFDEQGRVVRCGVGCANTNEKSNGFAAGFDTANSAIKKSKKRALVDLALSIASASDWFTQDIEDTENEERAKNLRGDDDAITAKQLKRIFAIAATKEITVEKAKALIATWGFTSTKDIKQKDYDAVCDKLEKYGEGET